MKPIGGILKKMNAISITGAQPANLSDICYDSREARRNSTFVAIRGTKTDGHQFIKEAVRKGATTIVAEKTPTIRLPGRVSLIIVPDSRAALAQLSDYFYDSPSSAMRVVGVTGTNGKTTVTHLLRSIIKAMGKTCGTIGTIAYDLVDEQIPASKTTPESLDLQRMMKTMVDRGADYCLLEVSSHALSQRRVEKVVFQTAVFTNLTQDHLDYHLDMEDYFKAKTRLFTKYAPSVSVINADDPFSSRLMAMIEGPVITFGLKPGLDVTARDINIGVDGIFMTAVTPAGSFAIRSALTGLHNVYNILAAIAVSIEEGVSNDTVAEGLENLQTVPGRFEKVDEGQPFTVAVDYAHTEDALINVLKAARALTKTDLITVFGCGGDRDEGKRPLMGRAAFSLSDKVVVTSDNPRGESPDKIIGEILEGIDKSGSPGKEVRVIPERSEAIRSAIKMAAPGDLVLIAGKGHEDYQIVGGRKFPFDDRKEAATAIKELNEKI